MTANPQDFVLYICKLQFETALRALESVVEAAERLREAQLDAATWTHAELEATRKALAEANDLPQVWKLQAEWARSSATKSLEYWRSIFRCCTYPDAPPALPATIDDAYKQWLQALRRLYTPAQAAAA